MGAFKGHVFMSYSDVQEDVAQWFRHQPKVFFAGGYARLCICGAPI